MLIETAFNEIIYPLIIKPLPNGDELLLHLLETPALPKLILFDLTIQQQKGFDILAGLRGITCYQKLPVVVLSTSWSEVDQRKSLALGVNGFLTKPWSLQTAIKMFRRLVSEWYLN